MKNIIIITLSLLCGTIKAQDNQNRLSFEFGYGINSYSMGKLNEFYIDSFALKPHVNVLQDYIKSGQQFRLGLNYKPIGLFDFGLYGSYQYGNSKSRPLFTETNEFGAPIQEHRGSFELRTEAISVGINTTWYVSHLLKFQDKENSLNRFHFGIELNGGIGFSKAVADMRYETYPIGSFYENFSSRDFQGQVGLKAEYDFTKSPLFTTLGIRFGYQYFRTKTVKDRLGRDWEVLGQYPINLDFSGFYFGTYLKLGR
ncbi:MAG: hypothetical protein NZM15_04225 [Flavobacteriales bacterium]|nr:hypothetical protein [Flavobacteriales bacterium]MDW8431892.1 hypothetical protein [Flavobacteriales bacterium]